MNPISMNRLLDIGIALSKEKDSDTLLELILTTAMDITNCDGGTLYILNEDYLDFKLMITKSMGIHKGGRYGDIDLPPVPLSRQNACAWSAMQATMFNVPDVYNSEKFDFSGAKRYDAITGYRTVSMLVVPMEDDKGCVIGVLQLLNALDQNGEPTPFGQECEQVIRSLTSQAAISLTNMNYAVAVEELMDSFVRVMSTAIDARTPYNVDHTRGMVRVGERFVEWLQEQGSDWKFSPGKKRLFLMSIWLHDIGKQTIPLEIMDKESRLGKRLDTVLYRFQVISLLNRTAFLNAQITEDEFHRRKQELEQANRLLEQTNRSYHLTPQQIVEIEKLGEKTYVDENGLEHSWLSEEELEGLSVVRGNLTKEERKVMEYHVVMTERMLSEMHFPKEHACVPYWAVRHHELLNGSGYPRGLKGDEIPKETRLLTILDIFNALTQDRPYSPPKPAQKALEILKDMAKDGLLDREILQLFIESRAWEEKYETTSNYAPVADAGDDTTAACIGGG